MTRHTAPHQKESRTAVFTPSHAIGTARAPAPYGAKRLRSLTPPQQGNHAPIKPYTIPRVAQTVCAILGLTVFMGSIPKSLFAQTAFAPLTLSAQTAKAEHISYTTATTGTLYRMLPTMARVQADTTHTVSIQPAGSGKVLDILVLPGQAVQQGQALLHYQNHSLHIARLQETQTRTALAAALATQQEASQAYTRGKALAGQTVSVGDMQKRLAALQQAKENVAARQAELAVLKHRFDEEYTSPTEQHATQDETSTLVAPFAGTITRLNTAIAADVEPNLPLLTLSDSQHVWLVSDIAPQEAALLAPTGQQLTSLPAGTATQPLHTVIETIGAVADPTTGLVPVLSRVDNSQGHLRPGMVLNSLLQTTQSQSGLLVPADAVQTVNGQNVVFQTVSDTTIRPTPVETGLEENGQIVILSGLQTGARIVQHGSLALKAMMVLPAMDAE
ncbi:efflux RND transporter periplasmic adaptor subunit [Acetobacter orientalis]|uniref:efflux RND transporter periplasmic adaptor subunit n=1 Tax=Acetobacter orientalis TaxID=146474 RepID=UPI0039E7B285